MPPNILSMTSFLNNVLDYLTISDLLRFSVSSTSSSSLAEIHASHKLRTDIVSTQLPGLRSVSSMRSQEVDAWIRDSMRRLGLKSLAALYRVFLTIQFPLHAYFALDSSSSIGSDRDKSGVARLVGEGDHYRMIGLRPYLCYTITYDKQALCFTATNDAEQNVELFVEIKVYGIEFYMWGFSYAKYRVLRPQTHPLLCSNVPSSPSSYAYRDLCGLFTDGIKVVCAEIDDGKSSAGPGIMVRVVSGMDGYKSNLPLGIFVNLSEREKPESLLMLIDRPIARHDSSVACLQEILNHVDFVCRVNVSCCGALVDKNGVSCGRPYYVLYKRDAYQRNGKSVHHSIILDMNAPSWLCIDNVRFSIDQDDSLDSLTGAEQNRVARQPDGRLCS